jgi:hypothetical protein
LRSTPYQLGDVAPPENAVRTQRIKDEAHDLALNGRDEAASATVIYGLLDLAGQLEAATFHGHVGGRIEVPGAERTPFTKAILDAYTTLNQRSGDGAARADIAQNGVNALINGIQLLEIAYQQLGEKVIALEKQVAQLAGQ